MQRSGSPTARPLITIAWAAAFYVALGGLALIDISDRFVWIAIDVVAVLALIRGPVLFARYAAATAILLSWPAIAILSSVWSVEPGATAYRGLQLAATVLAAYALFQQVGLAGTAQILFWALLGVAGMSLAVYILSLPAAFDHLGNLRGVLTHKNQLGGAMGLEVVSAVVLFTAGWKRWLTFPVAFLAAFLLFRSGSATAMVVTFATLGTFVLLLFYRVGGAGLGLSISVALSSAAMLGLLLILLDVDPIGTVLDALGKDATLTGRSVLWEFGAEALSERPILGWGYGAWWDSSQGRAAYLRFVMEQNLGSFHNNLLDVAVGVGILGAAAFLIGILSVTGRAARAYLQTRDKYALWSLAFLAYTVLTGLTEPPLYASHSIAQMVVVVIALGVRATRPALARSSRRPGQEPALVGPVTDQARIH
jgi:exopolysaccharide production protein ExoQ